MRLSVTPAGEIKLTIPHFIGSGQIQSFLNTHSDWLESALAKIKPGKKLNLSEGETVNILGQAYSIKSYFSHPMEKAYIVPTNNTIHIFSTANAGDTISVQLQEIIKQAIITFGRPIITQLVSQYCATIGASFKRISIREQSSRWGSCSSQGNLNFNWKILLADQSVFSYVVAHEVAHLIQHNHSKAFWQLVETIQPGYKEAKYWLKHNANLLELF